MMIYKQLAALFAAALIMFIASSKSDAQGTPGYGDRVYAGVVTDKKEYQVGQPVKITFVVENRSNEPMTYRFSSGKQFDVWVMRNGKEVWQYSKGMMFSQMLTGMVIQPGSSRSFSAVWNQVDNNHTSATPGAYTIMAAITPTNIQQGCNLLGTAIGCVRTEITIGLTPKIVFTPISAIIKTPEAFNGTMVTIDGMFRGWKADGNSSACKQGPPVSRSDWAIADKTGCMYANGKSGLDPVKDVGKNIQLTGIVRRTKDGVPYVEVRNVQVKG